MAAYDVRKKKRTPLQRNPHVSPGERKKPRTGVSHGLSQAWKMYKSQVYRMVGKEKAAEKLERDWAKGFKRK